VRGGKFRKFHQKRGGKEGVRDQYSTNSENYQTSELWEDAEDLEESTTGLEVESGGELGERKASRTLSGGARKSTPEEKVLFS